MDTTDWAQAPTQGIRRRFATLAFSILTEREVADEQHRPMIHIAERLVSTTERMDAILLRFDHDRRVYFDSEGSPVRVEGDRLPGAEVF